MHRKSRGVAKPAGAGELTTFDAISPKQQDFIALLLTGKTISEAASLVKISRRQATYWLHEDQATRREYEMQRLRLREEYHQALLHVRTLALQALQDFLSPDCAPYYRLQALRLVYPDLLYDDMHQGRARSLPPTGIDGVVGQEVEQAWQRQREYQGNEMRLYTDRGDPFLPTLKDDIDEG